MVYTAENIALAYVEFFVHNYHLLNTIEVCLAHIEIPEPVLKVKLKLDELPEDWTDKSISWDKTQAIGEEFIQMYLEK